MSDAEVKIVVNPHTDGTVSAIREVEHALHALVSPISGLRDSFLDVAEAAGVAFAIEKISEFAEKMAEIGEHAVNMAAALNMSAEQFNTLSGAMSIVGANADALVRGFRTLQSAAQTAQTTPDSRQGFAFRQLGLDVDKFAETLRTKPEEAIDVLAEKFKELGSLGGAAGPFGVILARSYPEFVKGIKDGKEGLDELKQKFKDTGAPTNDMLKNLDGLAEKIHLAGKAFENLGLVIADNLVGPLGTALDLATKLVSAITKAVGGLPGKYPGSGRDEIFPGPGEPGGGPAEDQAGKTVPIPGTHKSASENFSHFNYGNMKSGSGGWNEYGSPEAGTQAIADWVKGHFAGGQDTIEKLLNEPGKGYSPRSDNPGKDLAGDMARRTGYGANDKLNLNDPEVLAKIVRAILQQEGAPQAALATKAAGGGTGSAEGTVADKYGDYQKDKRVYDEKLKDIKDREKEEIASLEKQKEAAHGNEQEQLRIDASIKEAKKRAIAEENTLNAAMAAKYSEFSNKYRQDRASDLKADTEFMKERNKLTDKEVAEYISKKQVELKLDQEKEASDIKHAEARAKIENQTSAQLLANEDRILARHKATQDAIIADELKVSQQIKTIHDKIVAEKEQLDQKYETKRVAAADKANEQIAADARKIDDKLATDLSQTIQAALTGGKGGVLQALQNELKRVLGDALTNGLKSAFESSGIGQSLSGTFLGSLFGGSNAGAAASITTAGTTFATSVQGAGTSFVVTITGAATGQAATGQAGAAGAALSTAQGGVTAGTAMAQGGATAASELAAGAAGSAGGGIFGGILKGIVGLIPGVGPFLSGMIPKFDRGGIVSAAGGWALPSFSGMQMAGLHANEMVLPSDISQGLQGMIKGGGGGGGTTVINVSAIDGQSVAKFFRANSAALVAGVNHGQRNGSMLRQS